MLVVEDEYLTAEDMRQVLEDFGADVIGPVATENAALKLISDGHIDCAIVDINLRGKVTFEVARALERLAIPFIFASGYAASFLPAEFESIALLEKPFSAEHLHSAMVVSRMLFPGADALES